MKKIEHTAEECNALEGSEIYFVSHSFDQTGIIVTCDPDVGIVVVDKDDKKDQLICIPGPSTKEYKIHNGESFRGHFTDIFDLFVDQLERGQFLEKEFESIVPPGDRLCSGSMFECPLS